MTLAPSEAATSEVRSVEALSTTMISSTNSGMRAQHLLDALLFVEAGDDDGDGLALIHESRIAVRPRRRGKCARSRRLFQGWQRRLI